jgi:hypothetical protein
MKESLVWFFFRRIWFSPRLGFVVLAAWLVFLPAAWIPFLDMEARRRLAAI